MHRCIKCGRFSKRITEGLPLSTCFPPDRPMTASTAPYAPFGCRNHSITVFPNLIDFQHVEYQLV